jgi:hypothetical protein
MNQIGVEAPEAELLIVAQEQANLKLNPAAVQAQISVLTIAAQLEQMQMQNAQMRQQIQGLSGGAPQQPPGSVLNPEAGAAAVAAQQAQAQPTAFEDQNQPITQAGSAPPQGAPPPGGANPAALTALTRQGQGMQQIAFNAFGGGNAQ